MFHRPNVTIINYTNMLHLDDEGLYCHGINDPSNEPWANFSPNLSTECKAYIEGLLEMDVSVDVVMDRYQSDPYLWLCCKGILS